MFLKMFKQDVQRWIIPEEISDPALVTWPRTLGLLYRWMSLRAMLWFRFGSWCKKKRIPLLKGFIQRGLYRWYGLEISPGAKIGGGLYIAHPIGSVIHVERIGENCSIIAGVTIGRRNTMRFPRIGNNVFVGAGARILGDIDIGDDAVVGANAVVIDDVPAGGTAVGIPAKIIRIYGRKVNEYGEPIEEHS
jgi:serine O-acetyltransferase